LGLSITRILIQGDLEFSNDGTYHHYIFSINLFTKIDTTPFTFSNCLFGVNYFVGEELPKHEDSTVGPAQTVGRGKTRAIDEVGPNISSAKSYE